MPRLRSTVSRGHRYAREVGYAVALESIGRRTRSQLRIAQLQLIKRWSPVIAVDTQGLRLFVDTRDIGIARQIVLHGAYGAEKIRAAIEILEHVDRHPFADGARGFLDIGANIGTAIIQAICHHGAAGGAAFEPHPGNIELLRLNLLANQVADRVSVVHCALTDTCGDVALARSPNHSGDHRVRTDVPAVDRFGETGRDVIAVPGLSLDFQIDQGLFDIEGVGLVSIDTQGHEAQVLYGAKRLCASEVPVMLEYWPYGLRSAGGYELLHELVADSYVQFVDLTRPFEAGKLRLQPTAELLSLDARLGEIGWADILLLSR